MIKSGLLIIAISSLTFDSFCQPGFEKIYGGPELEVFKSVIATGDGNILCGGNTRSYGYGNSTSSDFYFVKTSPDGDTLWTHTFGSATSDEAFAVAETPSGYVIAGTTYNVSNNSYDFLAGMTDPDGHALWEKNFGGSGGDYCAAVIPIPGNKILFCGSTNSQTNGNYDFFVIETDENGTQLNAMNFGGTGADILTRVVPSIDGGYLLVGYSNSGSLTYDVYAVKIDSNLVFEWSRKFDYPGTDIGYDATQDGDGNYCILSILENAADSSDIAFIKTDSIGLNAVILYPELHPGDYAYRILSLPDGYLLTGYTFFAGKGSEMLLMKTGFDGDSIWLKHYGGIKNEVSFSESLLPSGNIVLAGETEGFATDNFDAYLIRVNENGDPPCPQAVSFYASDPGICEDETMFFVNTTVSSNEFEWKKDGDSFSTGIDAAYYFTEAGNPTISLTSCAAVSSQQVTIFSKPPSHFIYTASGDTVSFFLIPQFSPLSFTWNFGDGSAENTSVPEPVHAYSFPGSYWVTFSSTDVNGCDSTFAEQILLTTGLNEPLKKNYTIFIAPNPVDQSAEINLSGNIRLPAECSIYDLSGQQVKIFTITEKKQELNTSGWDSGFYTLELKSANGIMIFNKLIVR